VSAGTVTVPLVGSPQVGTTQLIGFRRHLRAEVVAGEAAYLFSERGVTALMGSQVEALAPLLDGTRDLPAVLRDMPADTSAEQVEDLLGRLTQAGLLTLSPRIQAAVDKQTLAYWDTSGLDAATAVANIAAARVALITVGGIDGAAAKAALSAAGLTLTVGADDTADLSVVLCADYLDPALADVDAAHRAAGRPWLLAKPVGAMVWIGPVFDAGGQGCWHCLAARLQRHRQAEVYVQSALGRVGPVPRSAVSVPPLAATAMHVVALEAVKWLAGYRYPNQHSVWTFDSFDLVGQHHALRARPQCATCGDPDLVRAQARRPVVLRQRRKACYTGGGHRSLPPEQVLARYEHLVSPVTGVIKKIERDRRGPAFFNAYRSGPNLALGARNLRSLKSALRVENGGKGVTPLHAEVSALCEALERNSGHFHGDEERIRGSLRSFGEHAIHPNTCQLFHERQYAERAAWNANHSAFQFVCAPFDENAVMDWTPVWSLTDKQHRLLPTTMLYFGAPRPAGPLFACADSNGNAAGSSLEDAVLQGLLELVERDAVALWWYNRTRAPGVSLNAFADPWIDEMREVYAELGREVWVLDVTSDLRIPTMVALSRRTGGPNEAIMFGFGSHPDPKVAVVRALTELNQMMPTIVQLGPEGLNNCDDDPDVANWLRHATVANQPYLRPDPTIRPRRPSDYTYVPRADLAQDVAAIQAALTDRGMELLVLDQTRPDIGLPVVKVIVPGMRHFWSRFGPGRLYDVPVELGRLDRPTPYEELNPIPLFT
jgi:bacteriocin biosynthesis cyclodehydratase domain-containing protein